MEDSNPSANPDIHQIVINHGSIDDGLLHTDGMATWSAEKEAKSQAAHGVSVIEIARRQGNVQGDAFGCPDGLWFDPRDVLWIQTDPTNGEVRRFLTGPAGCEITGVVTTPDWKTLFVNIQHPGETPSERSSPAERMRFSPWPGGGPAPGRERGRDLKL